MNARETELSREQSQALGLKENVAGEDFALFNCEMDYEKGLQFPSL